MVCHKGINKTLNVWPPGKKGIKRIRLQSSWSPASCSSVSDCFFRGNSISYIYFFSQHRIEKMNYNFKILASLFYISFVKTSVHYTNPHAMSDIDDNDIMCSLKQNGETIRKTSDVSLPWAQNLWQFLQILLRSACFLELDVVSPWFLLICDTEEIKP